MVEEVERCSFVMLVALSSHCEALPWRHRLLRRKNNHDELYLATKRSDSRVKPIDFTGRLS
jgi:hypothetical protein